MIKKKGTKAKKVKEGDQEVVILREGEIFDYTVDPNLSGPGFQVTMEGDGGDETLVELTGLGIGDPFVVKAKMGSQIRMVPVNLPGADPMTDEEMKEKRSYVFAIDQSGEKIPLGQWDEAVTQINNDPIPLEKPEPAITTSEKIARMQR